MIKNGRSHRNRSAVEDQRLPERIIKEVYLLCFKRLLSVLSDPKFPFKVPACATADRPRLGTGGLRPRPRSRGSGRHP